MTAAASAAVADGAGRAPSVGLAGGAAAVGVSVATRVDDVGVSVATTVDEAGVSVATIVATGVSAIWARAIGALAPSRTRRQPVVAISKSASASAPRLVPRFSIADPLCSPRATGERLALAPSGPRRGAARPGLRRPLAPAADRRHRPAGRDPARLRQRPGAYPRPRPVQPARA